MKYTDVTGLKKFHVYMREDAFADEDTIFECWAVDGYHAIEQAENAYPACNNCYPVEV